MILGVRGEPQRDHYPVDAKVAVVRLRDRLSDTRLPGTTTTSGVDAGARGRVVAGIRQSYRASVFAASVRRLATRRRPDVVLTIGTRISLAAIAGLVGTGTPIVATERENPLAHSAPPALQRLRLVLYARCAYVVVLLESIAERFRDEWGLPQVAVIPNAQMFQPSDLPPIEERPKVVLSMGRLSEVKGLPSLLHAWKRGQARERGWRLRIVGEGPQRAELEGLIDKLGITTSVELPGSIVHVETEYRAARIFVLPSRAEGFPLALLEAMTFGCACVASDCPGGPGEMLNQGEAGVLVPVDDIHALSAALDRVTTDSDLASHLADAARLRAGDFGPDQVLAQWESVLARAAGLGEASGNRAGVTGG